jgi:hypothetical protein
LPSTFSIRPITKRFAGVARFVEAPMAVRPSAPRRMGANPGGKRPLPASSIRSASHGRHGR